MWWFDLVKDPRPTLAAFYSLHFAHVGIVLPFLAPWFLSRGFSPLDIGMLLAVGPVCRRVTPWTWGVLADRTGNRRMLMTVTLLLAAAAFFLLGWSQSFGSALLLMIVYTGCMSPALPLAEAATLEQSELRGFQYGSLRLFGSLAFIATSAGFGFVRDSTGAWLGFVVGCGLLVAAAGTGLFFPAARVSSEKRMGAKATSGEKAGPLGSQWKLVRLLLGCALMQASHGPYYAFYSIRLEELGHGGTTIGFLWAFAVICEVLLLARADSLINRVGTVRVLRGCLLLAAVRWFLISQTTSLVVLTLAQTLHAFTYAAFHVAALKTVFAWVGSENRIKGQSLYNGFGFGLGLLVGNLGAGVLADALGLPAIFLFAGGVATLGVLMIPGKISMK